MVGVSLCAEVFKDRKPADRIKRYKWVLAIIQGNWRFKSQMEEDMDILTRFNRNYIKDWQLDTLVGVSKGITADGQVNYTVAECLQCGLIQNRHTEVTETLENALLDTEESAELGDVAKTAVLPICSPVPKRDFVDNSFLISGNRKQYQAAIEFLGGIVVNSVTKTFNALLLGLYITARWPLETFSRKIEKAKEYRDSFLTIGIDSAKHWFNEFGMWGGWRRGVEKIYLFSSVFPL